MNICILDGFSVNPGDLNWDAMNKLGTVTVYDRTAPNLILERAADAEIVLTNKVPFNAETINALPKLRYIGVLATGYNIIDTEAAKAKGVVVTNIPAYSTMSVAQMAFAHILNITNRISHYASDTASGKWTSCPDFCYWDTPLTELSGKTMGIVGLGNTGMATARIALAFGMKVLAFTSKPQSDLPEGIYAATMEDLLTTADVISLHCPLNASTRGLIGKESLAKMKKTAILVNTGRGPLVNEAELAEALNRGDIAAFGADVLSKEPPTADNPLLSARNCFITPHIAWATLEARSRLMDIAVENIRQFVAGENNTNQVNK